MGTPRGPPLPKETVMHADHATPRSLSDLSPVQQRRAKTRAGAPQGLPPFWWFLPSVALGLCFWIVVLALLLG